MPAVVRIDTGGTHGYQARIGGSVGYESKLFSDKKWGGKRKAKAAAIAWLEERGDRYAPRRFGPKKGIQVNNVSGTPGVHQSQLTRNGNVSRYWAAHYSIGPNGKRTHRSKRFYFGVKRTEEEARALAEEFRTGWVQAFEENGIDGVKKFFKEWEEKHPSRKSTGTRSKSPAKSTTAGKKTTAAKSAPKKPAAKDSAKPTRGKSGSSKATGTAKKSPARKDSGASARKGGAGKASPAKSSTGKATAGKAPAKKKSPGAKKSTGRGTRS